MQPFESRETIWIDCAKLLAIIGVLVDHGKGILYEGETIQYLSFFSVSAFFFLSGMTSYYSLAYRKKEENFRRWLLRRLGRVLIPYCAAVAISQLVRTKTLNLGAYVLWTLHFNLEGQFYFVLIYLQLILAAPALYLLVLACQRRRLSLVFRAVLLVGAWELSLFCIRYTFALETYGGGKYLLGGTYLFLFVLGMAAADRKPRLATRSRAAAVSVLATVLAAGTLYRLLEDRFAWEQAVFGGVPRVNPPGPTLILYSLSVVFAVFGVCSLAELMRSRALDRLLSAGSWLGRRTLYIFLYHMLILDFLLPAIPFAREMGVWKTVVYMAAMIGLPVGGKALYDWVRKTLTEAEKRALT